MKKRPRRSPLANAPPQRVPGTPPRHGRVPLSPPIDLTAAPTAPQQTRAPRQRPVADVPNPRRPKAVRVVDGGELRDLFAVFPDLPRPLRPPSGASRPSPLLRFRTGHRS
jgi:hypothetical protein